MNLLIGKAFTDYKPPSRTIIVDKLIKREDKLMVDAPPGTGKSLFVIQLAMSVANGVDFIETYKVAQPAPVLYINGEMTEDDVQDRVTRIGSRVGMVGNTFAYLNDRPGRLGSDEGIEELLQLLGESNFSPALTIYDPIYSSVRGSMTADEVVGEVRRRWEEYIEQTGSAFLFSNQDHRPEKQRNAFGQPTGRYVEEGRNAFYGGVHWQGWVEKQLPIKKVSEREDKEIVVSVDVGKTRRRRVESEELKLQLVDTSSALFFQPARNTNPLEAAIQYLTTTTIESIVGETGYREGRVRDEVKRLLIEEKLEIVDTTRKPLEYKWKEKTDEFRS